MKREKITYNSNLKPRLLLAVAFFVFILQTIQAQQIPHYTQYLYNMQIINPAYVGVRSDLSITALSRQQWTGIDGAPTTKTFSVNGRTKLGLGLGATFVNDQIGLSEINTINFDGSYTLVLSQYSRLSLGLKLGSTFFSNNFANAITPDNDTYASTTGQYFNVGFGAFYYNDTFFAGVSLPYMLETPQFFIQPDNREVKIAKHQDIFVSTGFLMELSESISFKPSTMIRYNTTAPLSIDVNANFLYNEFIEACISYRYNASVSALFALIINKKIRVGYAYDYRTNNAVGNLNTHEFILQFDFDLQRDTRWLNTAKCFF